MAGIIALVVPLALGACGAVRGRTRDRGRSSRAAELTTVGIKDTFAVRPVSEAQRGFTRHRSRWIQVVAGATLKRFDLSEPAGVIRLVRMVVPHGTRAELTAAVPEVARVDVSTVHSTCQRRGAVELCTQSEEACPMPAATWRFRLDKVAGPAGEIRVDFVVG